MVAPPVAVIILAGQRAGRVNPLAERAHVSHKCLAPIRGKPLIAYVLDTVTAIPSVSAIRISAEPEAHDALREIAAQFADRGVPVAMVPSRTSLLESVHAAAGDDPGPFIITTADNVMLTREAFEQVRATLSEADGVFAFARKENVLAAHPEGQRNFYRFSDDEYANCNIYAIADRRALDLGGEVFRGGGQFMKSVWRTVRAFGPINILLLTLGFFDRAGAMKRLSRRLGMEVTATEFTDGALAIDVDNERTYRVCEELLARRENA